MPVTRVTTLSDQVDSNIVPERLMATLSEFFGVLGAALAGIGLYGLLAYTVARRTNEIGVRWRWARHRDVSRLVLGDALGMVCAGLAAGALMVFWSRPVAHELVQDLKPESGGPLALGGGGNRWRSRCWPRMFRRGAQRVWTRWWRCATSRGANFTLAQCSDGIHSCGARRRNVRGNQSEGA